MNFFQNLIKVALTFSWRRSLSRRNQSTNLQNKSMNWFLYDWDLRHERVTLSAIVRLHECQIFLFNILHNMRWRKQRTGKLSLRKSFPYNIIRAIENVILSFLESWFLHPTYKMTFSKSLIRENNPLCDRYSKFLQRLTLHKKSPYSEFFWSAFSRVFSHSDWISPYSVQMRENQGKVRTRITLNTDSFYAALLFDKVLPFGNFWQCGRLIFFFTLLHRSLFFCLLFTFWCFTVTEILLKRVILRKK